MPRYFPVIGSKIPVNDAREFSSERPINTGLHQPAPDKKGLNSRICPVNSRKLRGDRFVYDCTHHHPVFRYRTPRVICAFVPRIAGFFEFVLVSASVSAREKGGFGPSVSASKNSVPDSGFQRPVR